MGFHPSVLGPGTPLNRFLGAFFAEFTDYHAKRTHGRPNSLNYEEQLQFSTSAACAMCRWDMFTVWIRHAPGTMGPWDLAWALGPWPYGSMESMEPLGPWAYEALGSPGVA